MTSADHHLALGEPVLEVAVAQVEGVVRGRHAGRVRVPVEQVERERRLALEVDVDHVGPDQVVRAQHVEGVRHARAFEVAARLHHGLDRADLALVDEDLEVAGMGEVDLRGEEGRALDPLVAGRGHVGEGHGEQRAADAVADRGDVASRPSPARSRRAPRRCPRACSARSSFSAWRSSGLTQEMQNTVSPWRHRPADEALLRVEVEHVELVDPGRHDEERALQHRVGRRARTGSAR